MRRILTLFCILFTLICSLNAQTLNTEQMKEDFDFLYEKIALINPHLEIRRKVTGTDILFEIKNLRKEIDAITSDVQFYRLITKVLFLCQDAHTGVTSRYPYEHADTLFVNEAKKVSSHFMNKYYRYYTPAIRNSLRVFFHDGKFYLPNILDNDSNIQIQSGSQLIKINNMPVDEYMRKWNIPVYNDVKWSFDTNKYYTDLIFIPHLFKAITDTSQIINVYYNGETKDIVLKPHYIKYPKRDRNIAKVCFFEKDKILYIRIPLMDGGKINYFKQEIAKYTTTEINKVVIDVRGNGGGNDAVWSTVLSSIIKDSIRINQKLCFKDNSLVREIVQKRYVEGEKVEEEKTPLFIGRDTLFCIYGNRDINPADNSLLYDKNIYIMADDRAFSSTLSLISICNVCDNLVSVGVPSGYLGGEGIVPHFSILPNSKFIVNITLSLDAKNVADNDIEGYYHSKIEEAVYPSIDYYLNQMSDNEEYFSPYSEEFLYKHDPIFNKILLLE